MHLKELFEAYKTNITNKKFNGEFVPSHDSINKPNSGAYSTVAPDKKVKLNIPCNKVIMLRMFSYVF